MASYAPPVENTAIFDSINFTNGEQTLTQNQADKRYLRFPNAQGTENLQAINVNGLSNFNAISTFTSSPATGSNSVTIQIPGGNRSNSLLVLKNGGIDQITQSTNTNFVNNLGTCIIATNKSISLDRGPIVSSAPDGADTNSVSQYMTSTDYKMDSTFNGITSNFLNLNKTTGLNINSVTNFTNTAVGSLTSSATQPASNDSSNKIPTTAWVQSIIPSIPFAPKFANYANYQTINGFGYSQGTIITWAGSWTNLDYVIFRITAQANWTNNGSSWENYASTSGQLILRPFYAVGNPWSGVNSNQAKYSTNSGNTNIGPIAKAIYYTSNINNGTQDFFFIYGTSNQIQLMFLSPQVTGGWSYSHLVEYVCHSTSGGTITFSNGTGTNNSLP